MRTLPGPFEPGRVPLPPTPAEAVRHVIRVRPQDVDPMNHVNNAAYLDYLEETLLDAGPEGPRTIAALPRRVRLEYLAPAAPAEQLTGAAWRLEDQAGPGWAWRLTDDDARELARGRLLEG
jgi:acyl-ACP thioesterase